MSDSTFQISPSIPAKALSNDEDSADCNSQSHEGSVAHLNLSPQYHAIPQFFGQPQSQEISVQKIEHSFPTTPEKNTTSPPLSDTKRNRFNAKERINDALTSITRSITAKIENKKSIEYENSSKRIKITKNKEETQSFTEKTNKINERLSILKEELNKEMKKNEYNKSNLNSVKAQCLEKQSKTSEIIKQDKEFAANLKSSLQMTQQSITKIKSKAIGELQLLKKQSQLLESNNTYSDHAISSLKKQIQRMREDMADQSKLIKEKTKLIQFLITKEESYIKSDNIS
jgi:chromosome segregation ATPase